MLRDYASDGVGHRHRKCQLHRRTGHLFILLFCQHAGELRKNGTLMLPGPARSCVTASTPRHSNRARVLTCATTLESRAPAPRPRPTPQANLVKDESAVGQKWAEAGSDGSFLERKADGQLIFGGVVRGEAGPEVKQWTMRRA